MIRTEYRITSEVKFKRPENIFLWKGNIRRTSPVYVALIGISLVTGCGRQTNNTTTPAEQTPGGSNLIVKTPSGMEMVEIPGGEFMMGMNDGPVDVKPAHSLKLDSFLMDRCEVNQAVYEKLTGNNPSRQKNPLNPVEQVTWSAAVKFCNARSVQEGLKPCYDLTTWTCNFEANGYRLPTEAEWEYACRAGSSGKYFFGDQMENLRAYAWYEANSDSKPHKTAQKKPNGWGLYDMAGNVWEWCNDFYAPKYYRTSAGVNPTGPSEGEKRVLRGGAWSSSAENCTSFVRNSDEAGTTDVCLTMDSNGFRCVRRK